MTSFFQYISEVLYLLGESRRKLPLLIILFLFLSFLNIAGLGLIGSYLALVVNSDLLTEGRFRDIIETIGMPLEQQPLLILLGFGLLGVFLLKAISGIFLNRIIITYSLKQRVRLCSFLMQAFQQMPYTEHIKRNSSEYIHSLQYLTSVLQV